MGRVKQSLIVEEEFKMSRLDQLFQNRGIAVPQWRAYGLDEKEWAEYQKEFNAWLDDYESSFGGEEQS